MECLNTELALSWRQVFDNQMIEVLEHSLLNKRCKVNHFIFLKHKQNRKMHTEFLFAGDQICERDCETVKLGLNI